jgi:trimeric autotransporter adhesin
MQRVQCSSVLGTAQRGWVGTMVLLACMLYASVAFGQTVSTVAGGGVGDGGSASASYLYRPTGVATDGAGNVYIVDQENHRVRKVDTSGNITTVAGTGSYGYSGDGGIATVAQLYGPRGVAVDASGNIYISELATNRVRKVDTAGIITTVAGTGSSGFSGDGGPATAAKLNGPEGLYIDASGNLYIAEISNHRIRKVDTAGIISTVAGVGTQGFSGDGGAATAAELNRPEGVSVDAAGNMYIADTDNNRIRKVDTAGVITTVAGTGVSAFSGDGGVATAAGLYNPNAVKVDGAGNLYIVGRSSGRVRKVDTAGVINTIAGGGSFGTLGDGGVATSAFLWLPRDVALDSAGNIYITDSENKRVRKVDTAGVITTLAGGSVGDGGAAASAALYQPQDVAVDGAGNLYIADDRNNRIRKVDTAGNISTVAGTGIPGYSGDGGLATAAQLGFPKGLFIDAADNLYIADSGNRRIRKVDAAGIITTVAGDGGFTSSGDGGLATAASLQNPIDVFVDAAGNLYIADEQGHRVRKVDTSGIISTFAGTGVSGLSGDGGPATAAQLNWAAGVFGDAAGNIYIVDQENHRIRKVDTSGTISTFAGSTFGFSGDGGPVAAAQFNRPTDIFIDSAGNLYINDQVNNRVRKVDTSGIIFTFAGSTFGFSGDGGPALSAQFANPADVAVDASGNIYVADWSNNRVRKITSATVVDASIPQVAVPYNSSASVPVQLSNTSGRNIVSAEVFVEYDGDLVSVFSTSTTGTLLDGDWSVETNIEQGAGSTDILKIAMATGGAPLSGAGDLINVTFLTTDTRQPTTVPLVLSHVLFNDGDPTNTKSNGALVFVGADGTIDSSPATVIPRETITITVVDIDADSDGSPGTDQIGVSVVNTTSGDVVNLTLNEDAVTAGTFVGTVDTEFGAAAIVDGLLQAQAGEALVATYVDALDAAGNGPTNRTDQTDVIGGADGSAQITDATQPGDVIYIKVADADLNADNGVVETVQVVVSSSNGELETVTLTEVDVDDAVFFGSLASAAGGAGTDDDGTINGIKGDVLTLTYDDVVTALGDQVDRTDTDQVVNPFGDADGNLSVQAFDAAQTLLHVLVPHLTGLELIQANVDLDPSGTGITPFDASLILQKRVGLISLFPVQTAPSTNHPQATPASAKGVVDTRQLALSYVDGYLSLSADERSGILSGDVLVAGVDGKVVLGEELGQFIASSRRTDEGLRIVFAGAEAVMGPGELLRIYPGVGPDTASLVRAQFNDGQIQMVDGRGMAADKPRAFALHANWPNPFNPETSIRFELAQGSAVQLEVFDALGQKVRTLVQGQRAAGSYQVLWDGRNASGAQVSSGVYFYRLQSESFVQMHRMLLLK